METFRLVALAALVATSGSAAGGGGVGCEGGHDVVVADARDRLPVGDCEVVRH
jgi:hypothetical protein